MRNFRRVTCFALAVLFLSGLRPPAALALEDPGGNPGTKITRGIVNVATGWLEVPAQMAEQKKTDTTQVWWFFHGLLRGGTLALARTCYGVWDIVTFPVAPYNAPLMEPDVLIKPKDKPRDLQPLPPEAQ